MYTFTIKDSGPDLDIIITRAMLALAAIAAVVYRSGDHYYLNLLSAGIILIAAVFIKLLLVRLRVSRIVLVSMAAVVLFIATRSVTFAVILMVYGYLIKYLNRRPVIAVSKEGITIQKLFASPAYHWDQFSNIILKDNLLTLDFKNNKLLQVNIDGNDTMVDEGEFNAFCRANI